MFSNLKKVILLIPAVAGMVILSFTVSSALAFTAPKTQIQQAHTLRGVSHVHTKFSHDSNAGLDDVLKEMKKNSLDFVIVTDHNSIQGGKAYEEMKNNESSLLIFANEISGPDGHLIALGIEESAPENTTSQKLIDWIHDKGGYAILAHPLSPKEPWGNWTVKNWDGFEVYNFAHELYNQDIIGFGLDMYMQNEDEVLKTVQIVSPESKRMWDELLQKRHVAAMSGSNAHLKKNRKYFNAAFKSSIIYAIADELNTHAITAAIAEGRSYMVFETLGRADKFLFTAENENLLYQIGDTVSAASETALHIQLPEPARILIIHNGQAVQEENTDQLTYAASDPGAYRVEVYKGDHLWIFTNPIYVAKASA